MDKDAKIMPRWKYTLSSVVGFGLAGAIWGEFAYSGEPITYPLIAAGGLGLAVLGGLGLSLPSRNVKITLRVVLLGLVGTVFGFFLAMAGIYHLSIAGSYLALVIPDFLIRSLGLEPKLSIGLYWLNFALVGAFMGLFFAIGLKQRILGMILRGAAGFGLAAIISPIIGNLIGNLFNSLLVSYLSTFLIIGMILGLSLSLRISKKEKEGPIAT